MKINQSLISTKVQLNHDENSVSIEACGKRILLMPSIKNKLSHLPQDKFNCLLNFECDFTAKKIDGQHKVYIKSQRDSDQIKVRNITLYSEDCDLSSLANANLFVPQAESSIEFITNILNDELISGRFDHLFNQDNEAWTRDELLIALNIYLQTKDQDYASRFPLIEEKIKSGEINRSSDAIDIKINYFRHFDTDSSQEGLNNASNMAKAVWLDYKNKNITS